MSPLIVRPGRNAAREAKRLKEVRKVKDAILWHERQKKKRQETAHRRWEIKSAALARIKWENDNVKEVRKTALRNAKEDWALGNLRPNRAYGEQTDIYGAITRKQAAKPEIPVHAVARANELETKRGVKPKWPLVVDDEKYFPIVKDDRVVVVRGREKGKVGIVRNVAKGTHDVIVTGVNLQYYDSKAFNSTAGAEGPKRSNEVPIPIEDVRLVIPYEIIRDGKRSFSDVIVDEVHMERHTTGIDPFTGHDYGNATIPADHQYDPNTGLPIFHRYVAGTDHRIEWPWEKDMDREDAGITNADGVEAKSMWRRIMGSVRHPVATLRQLTSGDKVGGQNTQEEQSLDEKLHEIEQDYAKREKENPSSGEISLPGPYEFTDTTRNIVEDPGNLTFTLKRPPFPVELMDELRIAVRQDKASGDKDASQKSTSDSTQDEPARRQAKPKRPVSKSVPQQMKTPMQLRWELEHAQKIREQKKSPLVPSQDLLLALGQHIQKAERSRRHRPAHKTEELD